VVQPGGTLWTLAREHYGAGRRYPVIVSANAGEIADPALIFPGQRLVLPPSGRSD
jgi:nucleoid-associated protein YgaU